MYSNLRQPIIKFLFFSRFKSRWKILCVNVLSRPIIKVNDQTLLSCEVIWRWTSSNRKQASFWFFFYLLKFYKYWKRLKPELQVPFSFDWKQILITMHNKLGAWHHRPVCILHFIDCRGDFVLFTILRKNSYWN